MTLRRTRYVEVWSRDPQLGWRIVLFIDNRDQEPELMEEVLLQLAAVSAPGRAQRWTRSLVVGVCGRNPLEKPFAKSLG